MNRTRLSAAAAALLLAASFAPAGLAGQDTPIPRPPDRWVTDRAGFLSRSAAERLDLRLEEFERETGHQVIVYIDRTTGGVPLEDWAVRAFERWQVGRAGLDDGVVLFLMAEDRAVRIEVGYGLEGDVPDIAAGRVIDDVLVPSLQAGDNDGAVTGAVTALMQLISGEAGTGLEAGATDRAREGGPGGSPVMLIIFGIIILILFITNPRLALLLLWSLMAGGRGGGGGFGGRGGGGGGFRGGGGRSGGGGASGRW